MTTGFARTIERKLGRGGYTARFVMLAALLLASAPSAPAQAERGPVTNLPIPRFVSLKVGEANARRGPALTHRIDWVFQHKSMPLEITAEYGHWRRVRDREGAGGWVHYALISGIRTILIDVPMAEIYARPVAGAPVVAKAQMGVVGRLGKCQPDWCRITVGGHRGWVRKATLWGVKPNEIRD